MELFQKQSNELPKTIDSSEGSQEVYFGKLSLFGFEVASFLASLKGELNVGKRKLAIAIAIAMSFMAVEPAIGAEKPFFPSEQPPQPAADDGNRNPKDNPQYMLETYADPGYLFSILIEGKDTPPPPVSGRPRMPAQDLKLVDLGQ